MSKPYDEEAYNTLYKLFAREAKRVEVYKSRKLTENLNLRNEYKHSLIKTYNDLVDFCLDATSNLSLEEAFEIRALATSNLKRLQNSFQILQLDYTFDKNSLKKIEINDTNATAEPIQSTSQTSAAIDIVSEHDSDIISDDTSEDDTKEKSTSTPIENPTPLDNPISTTNPATDSNQIVDKNPIIPSDNKDQSGQIIDSGNSQSHSLNTQITEVKSVLYNLESNIKNNSSKMTNDPSKKQTAADFISLAYKMINYKYDGEPLALESFIDAINLLKELCEPDNNTVFLKFVMTRLEGVAREKIVTEPRQIDDIITQLKEGIKTESSKVIEGRMLALRADKTNLTKFSEKAEELAEQFRRSLCVEGFSKEKAKELSIEKTVELCRKSAKSDTVRAVIAASHFTEPKEVIAKMIVEINNLKQDRKSTQYTHNNNNHNRNSPHTSHNRYNNRPNNRYNNNNNRNGRPNSYNNSNRNSYQNNNNNRVNGQNNYSHNNSRTFTNNNRRSNEQHVRIMTGNETSPGNGGSTSNQSE